MDSNGFARRIWSDKPGNPTVVNLGEVKPDRTPAKEIKQDGKHAPHDSGLSVGVVEPSPALVQELQDEIRLLTERVSNDSQRFADYENEIHVLKAQLRQEQRKNARNDSAPTLLESSPSARPQTPGLSRFGSFMRRPVTPSSDTPTPRERELELALTQEQTQRAAAEKKIKDMDNEIEELSSTLFEQANEMVSAERRENAELKDRIQTLENHEFKATSRLRALEQRETDRKRRMEKLEGAILRIEKARALLVPR